jgi:hypothetical protein
LLDGPGRTGRLSAAQDHAPALEVCIERGRVVDAAWGRLRALSALEMGAAFLPHASFVFSEGLQSQARTLDLRPMDLAARLAEVAREGVALARSIPGPEAVPTRLEPPPQRVDRDPEAARLLDQIDGRRSVAELVEGRQPLVVLRGLASLVEHGAVGFQPTPAAAAAPPPAPAPSPPAAAQPPPMPRGSAAHRQPRPRLRRQAWLPVARPLRGVMARRQMAGLAHRPEAPEGAPAGASSGPAAPDGQAPGTREAWSDGRVGLVIVAVVLVVFVLAIVDSSRSLTPETLLPAARRPAATAASAPTQPVAPPTLAQPPTAAPTLAPRATAAPTLAQPAVAAPAAATSAPVAVSTAPRTVLDEGFATGAPGWPNAATSSAWWDSLGYHLQPRVAGQHVAIVAPGGAAFGDVVVTGLFHKRGGPAGGGYGLILRAQGGPLNGTYQGGRYYVFEVGDRGDVGAWRREEDRWVDLVSWTHSSAVYPGDASNRLEVRAMGSRFTFSVNDTPVAQVTDDSLATGAVGVFTGGDGNQVVLERFTVSAL